MPKLCSGGLLVADNMYWSGRILDATSHTDLAVARFSDVMGDDPRVENVLPTARYGIMLLRRH